MLGLLFIDMMEISWPAYLRDDFNVQYMIFVKTLTLKFIDNRIRLRQFLITFLVIYIKGTNHGLVHNYSNFSLLFVYKLFIN